MGLPLGVRSFDVEIQAFLTDGFSYIRQHPEIIDEIFGHFKQSHLEALYGETEIKNVKQWVLTNDIPVIQSWNLAPSRVPCVSVHLAASNEQTQWSYLGDHAETGVESGTGATIVDTFVPADYDATTGRITINPDTTDISGIRPGYILHDASGEKFLIVPVIDIDNNFFSIDTTEGSDVDVRELVITDSVTYVKKKYGQGEFHENVDLGIHGSDDNNTVLWMYYMVVWTLFRFKPVLEKRGIDLHTFSASEFDRQSKFVQENVYSRWIRLGAKSTVEWSEDALPVASSFELIVQTEES